MRLVGVLLAMLARPCATPADAAEYFIAAKASAGAGTRSDPFGLADLPPADDMYAEGPALSILQPGDTLTFLPGTYELHTSPKTVFGYIRPVRSGTAEKPITFRAAEGGKVILRSVSGTQGVLGTVKIRGWVNLDHIRFHGLVVECRLPFDKKASPELNGIRLAGKNNEVAWCRFVGQYLPTTNNFDGIRIEHAVEAHIHHNEIFGWRGDHWNSNGIKVYCSDRCVFEDNYIHDNHTGIYEKDAAAGNVYRRNYITNNAALAFLGSNQTAKGRADAQYSVYENVFSGPVNLLTLSRGIEFHDNLLLNLPVDRDHAGYAVSVSGGKVYRTRLWNNVCIARPETFVAYGMDQTRWIATPPDNPLDYCDHNVYTAAPTYRFGRYSAGEDVFTLEQMRASGFERNTRVMQSADEVYEDQKSYKLRPQWLKSGRNHDPVGPDDVASIIDTGRYGPSARPHGSAR